MALAAWLVALAAAAGAGGVAEVGALAVGEGAGARGPSDAFELAGIKASFITGGAWSYFQLLVKSSDLPKLGGAVSVQQRFRDLFGKDVLKPTADAHTTLFSATPPATRVKASFLGLSFLVTELARELWETPNPPKLRRFKEDFGHKGITVSCFTGGGSNLFALYFRNDELRKLGNLFRNEELRKFDGIFYVQEQLRQIFGNKVIDPLTRAQKTVFAAMPDKHNRETTEAQFSAVQSLVAGLVRALKDAVTPCNKALGSKAPCNTLLCSKALDRPREAVTSFNKVRDSKVPRKKLLGGKAPCNKAPGGRVFSKVPCKKALGSKAPCDKTMGHLKEIALCSTALDCLREAEKLLGSNAPCNKAPGSRALDRLRETVTSYNKAPDSKVPCKKMLGSKAPCDKTLRGRAIDRLKEVVTSCSAALDSDAFVRHHTVPVLRKLEGAMSFVAETLARPKREESLDQTWSPVFFHAPRRTKKRG